MRIAFVVQRYGPHINGGAEQHCRLLAENMTTEHEVDVLTTACSDYYTWANDLEEGKTVINGVTVRRFRTECCRGQYSDDMFKGLPQSFYGFAGDFNWLMQQGPISIDLINYINYHRHEYDIFIFFTYLYFTTVAGLMMVPEKSILIPTAHDEEAIYKSVFRTVFHLPRAIFYNTDEEMRFVQRLFNNQYIPSDIGGIGFDGEDSGDAEAFRKKFSVQDKFLLYAGRITERKGCDELFDFFERSETDFKLVLIGKEDIPVPKSDKICSLGFVSDEDKKNAMKACSALIIPSRYESFSMVLAEAMLNKKPVIASGLCDVLKGHCRKSCGGIYYTGFNEFQACLDYISDSNNAEFLGKNGREYIQGNYTWSKITSKLTALINKVKG